MPARRMLVTSPHRPIQISRAILTETPTTPTIFLAITIPGMLRPLVQGIVQAVFVQKVGSYQILAATNLSRGFSLPMARRTAYFMVRKISA